MPVGDCLDARAATQIFSPLRSGEIGHCLMHSARKFGERVPQIRIRFEFVGSCGLHHTVKMGTRLGAAHRISEQSVAPLIHVIFISGAILGR